MTSREKKWHQVESALHKAEQIFPMYQTIFLIMVLVLPFLRPI